MVEFFIMLFIVYITYILAKGILTILGAFMLSTIYVALFCVALVVAIVKEVAKLYAKALGVNPVITIGTTCVAFATYTVASH